MDDSLKTAIKLLAVGVGGYFIYQWLQTSGLWAQWFGGGNTFSNPKDLLAYCAQNPSGVAVYVDGSGKTAQAPCSQWLAANPSPASVAAGGQTLPPAGTVTSGPVPAGSIDPVLLQQLQNAAIHNAALGSDSANVDQWNYLLQQINPNAQVTDLSSVGIVRGTNDTMSSFQYLTLRAKAGLSGMRLPPSAPSPYRWVM